MPAEVVVAIEREVGEKLPRARKGDCANEYRQAAIAFRKTFMPDIDQKLAQKVQGMEILNPNDFK